MKLVLIVRITPVIFDHDFDNDSYTVFRCWFINMFKS